MVRILVVDDDEQILGLMQLMLSSAGYEVLTARNGKEGLKTFENTHIDLVLTDLVMPEMEGIEMIMGLKKKHPDAKIIAVSGGGLNSPDTYLNLAAVMGANKILTKPFSRKELLEAIKQVVG